MRVARHWHGVFLRPAVGVNLARKITADEPMHTHKKRWLRGFSRMCDTEVMDESDEISDAWRASWCSLFPWKKFRATDESEARKR
jgi:hypothetical protein